MKARMVAELERRAKQAGEDETALDYVLGRIEDGDYLADIADELKVSDAMLRRWIKSQEDGKRAYIDAKAERAHSLVEKAYQIADEVIEEKSAIAKAKLQIDQLNFIAAKQNRRDYGADAAAQVNVQVNFDQLYLDALRRTKLPDARAVPLLSAGEADVELVQEAELEALPARI